MRGAGVACGVVAGDDGGGSVGPDAGASGFLNARLTLSDVPPRQLHNSEPLTPTNGPQCNGARSHRSSAHRSAYTLPVTHAASDTAPPRGPSPRSSTDATTKKMLDWEERGVGMTARKRENFRGGGIGVFGGGLAMLSGWLPPPRNDAVLSCCRCHCCSWWWWCIGTMGYGQGYLLYDVDVVRFCRDWFRKNNRHRTRGTGAQISVRFDGRGYRSFHEYPWP